MNSLLQMQAVVEAPYSKCKLLCPWQLPEFKPLSMIRLSGEMTYPEIGLVFAQLTEYNRIEFTGNKQIVLGQILDADNLVLPGGIEVVSEEKFIGPSCCCGLERWREWTMFLETGDSPWLGHDPSPWLEMQGDIIRVWSDGGIEPVSDAFCIDVARSDFEQALICVERELQVFLYCIESWAQEIGFTKPTELSQKFDQCFKIGKTFTAS